MNTSTALPAGRLRPAAHPQMQDSPEALRTQIDSLRDQLRRAQKFAALGTTSAMLAHEYNNLLAPIVGYAEYVLDKDDVPLMRKTLSLMLKQYGVVQALSDRVLGFSREEDARRESVAIKGVIEDAIGCLGRDLHKDNINLVLHIDEGLCVLGNRNQLQQVFFNMALNARQAMLQRGGLLKITATPISESRVTIHVRDTGRGIKQSHLERIFEPFFSTKHDETGEEQKGIGLGLVICKQIIEEHAGTIQVESAEGHGATFALTLPLAP